MKSKAIRKLDNALRLLKFSMVALVFFAFFRSIGGFSFLLKPENKKVVVVQKQDKPKTEDIFGSDVENGIHIPTGFIAKRGYVIVIQNCITCHSSKIITQNRMDAKTWRKTIKWMQKTQNLWDLGVNEDKIVAYLGKYYAPKKEGRRKALVVEEWYELK